MWEEVGLTELDNAYPLDAKGAPRYKKNNKIPATYKVDEKYGEGQAAIELFDGRNKWLKQGLLSRIFPTWSVEKFYQLFGSSLYKVLLKYYHLKKASNKSMRFAAPEDYWIDVQLYFLQKTEKEQTRYTELVKEHGSFCHYPMEKSYKSGKEILNGLLWLYNEKIKDTLKNIEGTDEIELDSLKDVSALVKSGIEEFNPIGEEFLSHFFQEAALNPLQKTGVLTYYSLGSSRAKKIEIVASDYGLDEKFIRKIDHILFSDYLPKLLNQSKEIISPLDISTGASRRLIENWLRAISNRMLDKDNG